MLMFIIKPLFLLAFFGHVLYESVECAKIEVKHSQKKLDTNINQIDDNYQDNKKSGQFGNIRSKRSPDFWDSAQNLAVSRKASKNPYTLSSEIEDFQSATSVKIVDCDDENVDCAEEKQASLEDGGQLQLLPYKPSPVDISDCGDELNDDCIFLVASNDARVAVKGENQFGSALVGIGGQILRGLASADLSGLVNGVKQIFAPSTDDFRKRLHKEDHQAYSESKELYNSLDLLFQGMLRKESTVHTALLKHLAKSEKMEIEVLNSVERYVQYLFYVSAGFYGIVSLIVACNIYRSRVQA